MIAKSILNLNKQNEVHRLLEKINNTIGEINTDLIVESGLSYDYFIAAFPEIETMLNEIKELKGKL